MFPAEPPAVLAVDRVQQTLVEITRVDRVRADPGRDGPRAVGVAPPAHDRVDPVGRRLHGIPDEAPGQTALVGPDEDPLAVAVRARNPENGSLPADRPALPVVDVGDERYERLLVEVGEQGFEGPGRQIELA